MGNRLRRSGLAFLAVVGLLCCRPDSAEAHPNLAGQWFAPVPPGGFMLFEFAPGEYLGNGVWRGPFVWIVSGCPTSHGVYELKMFTGTQGTLGLREGLSAPGWTVGNVDLAGPVIQYLNTPFRKR